MALQLPMALAMYAGFQGLQQIPIPIQVEALDPQRKIVNLAFHHDPLLDHRCPRAADRRRRVGCDANPLGASRALARRDGRRLGDFCSSPWVRRPSSPRLSRFVRRCGSR